MVGGIAMVSPVAVHLVGGLDDFAIAMGSSCFKSSAVMGLESRGQLACVLCVRGTQYTRVTTLPPRTLRRPPA